MCIFRGRLSTLGLTLANIDLVNEAGILVGQFLRRLTPRLDVGTEMVYQYGKNIPGGQISVLSYAARYTANHFIAAATLGASGMFYLLVRRKKEIDAFSGVHLTYYHKQNENLAFGVEFECNANVGEAVTTLAYQTELPEEGVTMRASFDTNW